MEKISNLSLKVDIMKKNGSVLIHEKDVRDFSVYCKMRGIKTECEMYVYSFIFTII